MNTYVVNTCTYVHTYIYTYIQEGFKEEASEPGGTNSAAIAVTVTLLLVALALALGSLVYYRRRKRYSFNRRWSFKQFSLKLLANKFSAPKTSCK
jgi:LPXTG-motif cell wall-anchored protein